MTETPQLTCKFWVSGRVQGVCYRASTRDEAVRLGLCGYARNLSDGRVEVLASGEAAALASLEQWLWQGSPGSDVTDVEAVAVEVAAVELPAGFVTR